jgi:heme-degrading monooxygenase HmoA
MRCRFDSFEEFARTVETGVVPLFCRQKGFRKRVTSVNLEDSEAVDISFWDTKEDAEAYERSGYPEVVRALSKVIVGVPLVQTFELSNSTLLEMLAKAA